MIYIWPRIRLGDQHCLQRRKCKTKTWTDERTTLCLSVDNRSWGLVDCTTSQKSGLQLREKNTIILTHNYFYFQIKSCEVLIRKHWSFQEAREWIRWLRFFCSFSVLFSLLLWAIQLYCENGLLPCATDKNTQLRNTHISEKVPLRALMKKSNLSHPILNTVKEQIPDFWFTALENQVLQDKWRKTAHHYSSE